MRPLDRSRLRRESTVSIYLRSAVIIVTKLFYIYLYPIINCETKCTVCRTFYFIMKPAHVSCPIEYAHKCIGTRFFIQLGLSKSFDRGASQERKNDQKILHTYYAIASKVVINVSSSSLFSSRFMICRDSESSTMRSN